MDETESARRRIAYNTWANARMLADLAAIEAPADALRLAGHLVGAERLWLGRLVHAESDAPDVWPTLTVGQLDAQLRELHHAWRGYGQSLSAERLDDAVHFANPRGDELSASSADVLSHVLNHSTYHRGQVARILRQAGRHVTPTDLMGFVFEKTP